MQVLVISWIIYVLSYLSFSNLNTSKRHLLFNSVFVYYYILNGFSADRLATSSSLYILISVWFHLHRHQLYSNQEPTMYEADALSTRSSPPYRSSMGYLVTSKVRTRKYFFLIELLKHMFACLELYFLVWSKFCMKIPTHPMARYFV